MKISIKDGVALLIFQLLIAFICATNGFTQSPFQKFDDRVMIDIQDTRTPEQTGIFLFLTNTHRYAEVGIPAGLLIGGIARERYGHAAEFLICSQQHTGFSWLHLSY